MMMKRGTILALAVSLALVPGLLPGGDALAQNRTPTRGCGDGSTALGQNCCATLSCCGSPSVPAGATAKVPSGNSPSAAQPTGLASVSALRITRPVASVAPSSPVPTGSSPPFWGVLLC